MPVAEVNVRQASFPGGGFRLCGLPVRGARQVVHIKVGCKSKQGSLKCIIPFVSQQMRTPRLASNLEAVSAWGI
jgi:hypothetical protein